MLYGVRRDLQKQLVADGWNVRVYIPFGEAWYPPYLMRRLAERPANVLFIGRKRGPGVAPLDSSGPTPPRDDDLPPDPFLRITEIFHSIQGEFHLGGAFPVPSSASPGARCGGVWCDTAYAFQGGDRMTLQEIRGNGWSPSPPGWWRSPGGSRWPTGTAFPWRRCFLERGFTVLVETSGSEDISPLDPRVHVIMDLKCPGSGEEPGLVGKNHGALYWTPRTR